MNVTKNVLSRRSFLWTTGAVAAYASLPAALLWPSGLSAAPQGDHTTNISFIGTHKIQLTVEETPVAHPIRVPVGDTDRIRMLPSNNRRHQGYAELNGVTGFVSGDIHSTAAQLFRPMAHIAADLQLSAFEGWQPQIDQPQSWTVQIGDTPVKPISVYRKTLPIRTERTGLRDYAHNSRHLLTLELEAPVPYGIPVNIIHPGLGTFVAERRPDTVSETIHVCQQGYPTSGPKKGYVGLWLGHSRTGESGTTDNDFSESTVWQLVDTSTGEPALSGTLALAKSGDDVHMNDRNFNGCDIFEADFSALDRDGQFRLEVETAGSSPPFQVTANPYHACLRAAARWYFHQRSGIAIDAVHGEGRTRPRNGHPDDGLTVWQSDIALGPTREGFGTGDATEKLRPTPQNGLLQETDTGFPTGSEHPRAWGGWHDAGDWDRRIQHMDVVFLMAHMTELFATASNLDLNIPESGKPFADSAVLSKKSADDHGDGSTVLPDLIHEALWGISLWRRTQTRDGGIIGGVEYSSDGVSGAVSWNPHQNAYAYKTEPWTAYLFASAASKLGHVISATVGDRILGEQLITEALLAWTWAEEKWPDLVREHSTAAAADFDPADASPVPSSVFRARIAAAASVYRASGAEDARAIFEAHNPFSPQSDRGSFSARKGVYSYESFEYLRAANDGRDTIPDLVENLGGWAQWLATGPERMGQDYGLHSTDTYPWGRGWARFGPGSNWRASELALQFPTGDPNFAPVRNKVIEGMWFGLGCNPSNVSFVQGFGSRQFGDPSGADYDGFPKVPGQISFGVIIGDLYPWERDRIAGQLYPDAQEDWPVYAQIFESSVVNTTAEHGMKANAMEWLFANAFANEVLERA